MWTAFLGLAVAIDTVLITLLEGLQKLPFATKLFGDLTGAIAWLRADAATAADKVAELWYSTDQAGESATTATPPLIGLGDSMKETEERAKALKKAQEEYAALLDDTVSLVANYERLLNELGNTTYEGIAYDHARGISVAALAAIYDVTNAQVEQVIAVEKALAAQMDATTARIEASRAARSDAVAAVGQSLAGMPQVLRGIAQATGRLTLDATQTIGIGTTIATTYAAAEAAIAAAQTARLRATLPLNAETQRLIEQMRQAGIAGEQMAETLGLSLQDLVSRLRASGMSAADVARTLGVSIQTVTGQTHSWEDAVAGVANEFVKLAQVSDGAMGNVARGIGTMLQTLAVANKSAEKVGEGMAAWKKGDKLGGIAGVAGGIVGAIGAIDQATNHASKSMNILHGAATGAMTGAKIGTAILPGIGTAVGAAVGGIAGALTGWFKSKKIEKEVKQTRESFIQMAGGLAAVDEQAAKAGVTLTKMMNAKTPEAYTKAMNELNDALAFQDSAMKTLDDTVQKYGFTIQELGPAFARQQLDKRAQELYQDFQVLAAAGIPVVNILQKMAPSINEYVQAAIHAGAEIPAAMKPILQQMIDHGELLDENGQAYESLEDTGLSFSETMTQGFNRLIETVDKLTEAIARGLGIALDNLPDEVNIDVNVNTTHNSNTPETQVPDQPLLPEYAASGGVVTTRGIRPVRWTPIGSDIVPTMLTPGEVVLTTAQTGQLAAALQQSAAALQSVAQPSAGPERVEVNLTLNVDGVFSEGDLVSTIQRRVVPIIHETWNANVAGTRTAARDVLGVP